MIPSVCLFTNVDGINQQHKLKPNIDIFKLFVACTSWRNRIFDIHAIQIFESFQGTKTNIYIS